VRRLFYSCPYYSKLNVLVYAAASSKINTIVRPLMFISLATNILVTAMIIYRIHQFSRNIGNGLGRYSFIVQVLVESGALYAAAQIVECVLLATPGTAFDSAATWQGISESFWVGIVTPMAVSGRCIILQRETTDMPNLSAHRGLPQPS
jgi:hypothetical protein